MKLRYSIPLCFAVSICGALFLAWAGGWEPARGPQLLDLLLTGAGFGCVASWFAAAFSL